MAGEREDMYNMQPVGYIQSCFKYKNGTPRQPGICVSSQASLSISSNIYNNPEHSLQGIEEFSHVWIVFVFHKNNNAYKKAKVKPPRLNGAKVGVFSTRSPYRLNPIGLTLARLDRVSGNTVYLSGVDLLDGTPVLDIKPYISAYDSPVVVSLPYCDSTQQFSNSECKPDAEHSKDSPQDNDCDNFTSDKSCDNVVDCDGESTDSKTNSAGEKKSDHLQCDLLKEDCDKVESNFGLEDKINRVTNNVSLAASNDDPKGDTEIARMDCWVNVDKTQTDNVGLKGNQASSQVAEWITTPPVARLAVRFTPTAQEEASRFQTNRDDKYKLYYVSDVVTAITNILQADPRSVYRRTKCSDRLYYFVVDTVHVTAWFDDDTSCVEVVRVKPVSDISCLQDTPQHQV